MTYSATVTATALHARLNSTEAGQQTVVWCYDPRPELLRRP